MSLVNPYLQRELCSDKQCAAKTARVSFLLHVQALLCHAMKEEVAIGPADKPTGLHILPLDNNTLPQRGLIGEFWTNFRRPKNHRKTILNPPKTHPIHPQMVPTCDPRW